MWVGRPQGMNLFFVLPEGIWVEESLQAGRAGQLHTQVVSLHMGADGHMGGGRSFMTPLNPAMINPLSGPHFTGMGVMSAGMVTSRAWGMAKEGAFYACTSPSATDTGGSWLTFSDSWGWLEYSHSGSLLTSLGRGWGNWQGWTG